MSAQRIEHLQGRDDLTLVQQDQAVAGIKDALGVTAPDIDGLLVAASNGEVTECYGFRGCVPLLSLPVVRLF